MGDIYHAGEVYAGSVPIDDTQASEDTVYSSAKVESMMEEIKAVKTLTLTNATLSSGAYATPWDSGEVLILNTRLITSDSILLLPLITTNSSGRIMLKFISNTDGSFITASKTFSGTIKYIEL